MQYRSGRGDLNVFFCLLRLSLMQKFGMIFNCIKTKKIQTFRSLFTIIMLSTLQLSKSLLFEYQI